MDRVLETGIDKQVSQVYWNATTRPKPNKRICNLASLPLHGPQLRSLLEQHFQQIAAVRRSELPPRSTNPSLMDTCGLLLTLSGAQSGTSPRQPLCLRRWHPAERNMKIVASTHTHTRFHRHVHTWAVSPSTIYHPTLSLVHPTVFHLHCCKLSSSYVIYCCYMCPCCWLFFPQSHNGLPLSSRVWELFFPSSLSVLSFLPPWNAQSSSIFFPLSYCICVACVSTGIALFACILVHVKINSYSILLVSS